MTSLAPSFARFKPRQDALASLAQLASTLERKHRTGKPFYAVMAGRQSVRNAEELSAGGLPLLPAECWTRVGS